MRGRRGESLALQICSCSLLFPPSILHSIPPTSLHPSPPHSSSPLSSHPRARMGTGLVWRIKHRPNLPGGPGAPHTTSVSPFKGVALAPRGVATREKKREMREKPGILFAVFPRLDSCIFWQSKNDEISSTDEVAAKWSQIFQNIYILIVWRVEV